MPVKTTVPFGLFPDGMVSCRLERHDILKQCGSKDPSAITRSFFEIHSFRAFGHRNAIGDHHEVFQQMNPLGKVDERSRCDASESRGVRGRGVGAWCRSFSQQVIFDADERLPAKAAKDFEKMRYWRLAQRWKPTSPQSVFVPTEDCITVRIRFALTAACRIRSCFGSVSRRWLRDGRTA